MFPSLDDSALSAIAGMPFLGLIFGVNAYISRLGKKIRGRQNPDSKLLRVIDGIWRITLIGVYTAGLLLCIEGLTRQHFQTFLRVTGLCLGITLYATVILWHVSVLLRFGVKTRHQFIPMPPEPVVRIPIEGVLITQKDGTQAVLADGLDITEDRMELEQVSHGKKPHSQKVRFKPAHFKEWATDLAWFGGSPLVYNLFSSENGWYILAFDSTLRAFGSEKYWTDFVNYALSLPLARPNLETISVDDWNEYDNSDALIWQASAAITLGVGRIYPSIKQTILSAAATGGPVFEYLQAGYARVESDPEDEFSDLFAPGYKRAPWYDERDEEEEE